MNNYILSICIPTYNRKEYLKKTIESIIIQKEFIDGNVQICISDNCSTDGTHELLKSISLEYPTKIKIKRNDVNIWDLNFESALRMGEGKYLKLCNDTLEHEGGSLSYLISMILRCNSEAPLIFLGNIEKKIESIDEFVATASYMMTWIASFGIWRDELAEIEDFSRLADMKLIQVDVILRLIERREKATIVPFKHLHSNYVGKKGPYEFNEIFINNYLTILNEYVRKNKITKTTFDRERKKLLLNFCSRWAARTIVGYQSNFKIKVHFSYIIKWYKDLFTTIILYFIIIFIFSFYYLLGLLSEYAKKIKKSGKNLV